MADDRELLESELQALMEVSADFSKGLSTVASRMRAIKSYLNSNVQTKNASPRGKIRTRDSATSPILFRTTRSTSVSPDRFEDSAPLRVHHQLLDTSIVKTEKDDDDLYEGNHAVSEIQERIQHQRREQERAICNVGDICSVTRAGALNVLSPSSGTGSVTTRILSTTGGQINNKASLLKVANAAAQAAALKNGKPSGLIYILKPMGSGGMGNAKNPLKFNTVKKMRRILPNHNIVTSVPSRIGSMSIVMDRSKQKISPPSKLKTNLQPEDSSSSRVSQIHLLFQLKFIIL